MEDANKPQDVEVGTNQSEPPPGPATRPWLIMLYMSADAANLQAPLATELEELVRPIRERGTKDVYVVAQVETGGGVLKRYDLSSGHPRWVSSATTDELDDFLDFARQRCPATYEALVLWGHSAGPGSAMQSPRQPGDLVLETLQSRYGLFGSFVKGIDPQRIAARSSGRLPSKPVDLLGFDACYLGSLEVALQFRDRGHYMLAPESSISLTGWQFDTMVEAILADPSILPGDLVQVIVRGIGISKKCPTTLSLYDLSSAGKVSQGLTALVEAMTEALDGKTPGRPFLPPFEARLWILDAFHHALSTKVRQFLDLPDLCRRLAAEGPSPSIRSAARALLLDIEGSFVLDSVDITGHSLAGVSIYCPWPRATEDEVLRGARNVEVEDFLYETYDLNRTGWYALMERPELMLDAERRAVRRQMQEYLTRAVPKAAANGSRAWEAKPIEMETKPIEMELKPIEMEILAQA